MIITGQKTILFPIGRTDSKYLASLLGPSGNGSEPAWLVGDPPPPIQGQSQGWLAKTKQGKASKSVGVIFFTLITDFSAILQCFIDHDFSNGLDKEFRKKRYTYVEDAIKGTSVEILKHLKRIEVPVIPENKLSLKLLKKVGFGIEGRLKKSRRVNNEIKDIFVLALLSDKEVKE